MTSTSCTRETGEKKWVPTKCLRRRSLNAAASDVMGIDEVFEARPASAATILSRRAKTSRLTGSLSNTASMMRSQSL
jgi:hypothetical protein